MLDLARASYLKWDPQWDVEYDELRIKNKEGKYDFFYLSVFKPLINRYSFYSDSYKIPSTCEDFLTTKTGEDITLRIEVDEQRRNRGYKKYLKVQLDGLRGRGHLIGLEMEDMGIFDVALLSEVGQLVDADKSTRFDIEIDSKALVELRLTHILSDYQRLQKSIIGYIEELESAEFENLKQPEKEESYVKERIGLMFVSVEIEESSRRRSLDVIAYLCNVDDETDVEEVTVLSLTSEILKTQAIAYDFIKKQVIHNLRTYGISIDLHEDILKEVENRLGKYGVKINYY